MLARPSQNLAEREEGSDRSNLSRKDLNHLGGVPSQLLGAYLAIKGVDVPSVSSGRTVVRPAPLRGEDSSL